VDANHKGIAVKHQGKILAILILGAGIISAAYFAIAKEELQADPNAVFPVEMLEAETASGDFAFTVEIADENKERERGLMFRESMLPTHGMLFKFDGKQVIYMWMENTVLSLDMIFIRSDGSVARIQERTTPFSREIIPSGEPVSYVLELGAGMARQIGLKPNDVIRHRFFGNAP